MIYKSMTTMTGLYIRRKVSSMGVENNAIKMIKLLRENKDRRMKMPEIAASLGVKTRVISNWKKTILSLGYDLRTYGGYDGGYELHEEYLSLTELNSIKEKLPPEIFEKIKRINERI